MSNLFDKIDFGLGQVEYIDDIISTDQPLYLQTDHLREDLLQVSYYGGLYILDVGWYPSMDADGEFQLLVVREGNWSKPVIAKRTRDFMRLRDDLKEVIDTIFGNEKTHPEPG